jgi:hypothetical protein
VLIAYVLYKKKLFWKIWQHPLKYIARGVQGVWEKSGGSLPHRGDCFQMLRPNRFA